VYCSAEPAKRDHVRVQRLLPPGGRVTVAPQLVPGRYTVWHNLDGGWYLDVGDAGESTVAWPTGRPAR
jgi:hypothetical protein